MPFIKLNEAGFFYILHRHSAANKSPSVILIHGAGGNHLSMLPIFGYIKKKYGGFFDVLVFDLPFHFRSAEAGARGTAQNFTAPGNKGIDFYAEAVNALILKLLGKDRPIILIGHSMGAQICIKYSSLFPGRVKKAMLIAGCHNVAISDAFIKSLESSFERTIGIFLKDALAARDKNILDEALADIKRTPAETVINDFKYVKYFSGHYNADIRRVNGSKIFFDLIYSKKDLIIRGGCVMELHKKLANSEINEIPSKNHIDFLYENYYMEKEIDKFLLTQARLKL